LRFVPHTRQRRIAVAVVIALALLVSSGIAGARGQRHAPTAPPSPRQQQFTAAAHEFGVPEPLLLALSYALTRWEAGAGQPDAAGGFGPMHLTFADGRSYAANVVSTARGALTDVLNLDAIARAIDADPARHTLEAAATLVHVPPGQVSRDPRQNIRAGAALLASYAGTPRPTSLNDWRDAVAKFLGGGASTPVAQQLTDSVYDVLRSGARRTTSDGQWMSLAARPDASAGAERTAGAQCPAALSCQFVQAAGYDKGGRRADQVRYVVLGTAGSTYEQAAARMADPASATSSHYLVRGSDGQVTQLVRTADVAWYAGNLTLNQQSVSIALDTVRSTYSEQTYASTAALVRYLAAAYRIPLDRQHILGRDELPSTAPQAWPDATPPPAADPGAFWDWGHLFSLLGAPLAGPTDDFGHTVAFVPAFGANTQPAQSCAALGLDCADIGSPAVNFVPLRTAPSDTAPLLSDPALHPDGQPGSTDLADTGDKAVAGQVFAVAGRQGAWTAIWYGGQRAWFRDGGGVTRQVRAPLVTPAAGLGEIQVYAEPDQPAPTASPILAGQSYPLVGQLPGGWDVIAFDHRIGYVRSADVSVGLG